MKSLKIFLEDEAAKPKTAKELNALMAEWEVVASKLEVLEDLTKKLKKHGADLESEFFALAKASTTSTVTIRSTIVAYKKASGRDTPKYKEAFEKALSVVTEEQKSFLEEFLKSVTTKGEGKESLSFTNPRVQKLAERLKNAKTEEAVTKIAAEILDLQPELDESLKKVAAKVKGWIAGAIKSLRSRLSRIDAAVSNLKKISKEKALSEAVSKTNLKKNDYLFFSDEGGSKLTGRVEYVLEKGMTVPSRLKDVYTAFDYRHPEKIDKLQDSVDFQTSYVLKSYEFDDAGDMIGDKSKSIIIPEWHLEDKWVIKTEGYVKNRHSVRKLKESMLSEADQRAISDIINSESYKTLLNQAPKYAHEIVNSLEGDLVDMKRDPKNFQSLTLNMLKAPVFTKTTKQAISPVVSRALEKLQGLVHQFLPKPAIKKDSSVWNGERVVREAGSSAPMVHATKDGRFMIGRASNGKIEFKYVQGDGWLTINNRDMSTSDSKKVDFKSKASAEAALSKLKTIREGQSIHDTYKGKVIAYLEKNIPRTLTSLYEIDEFIAKLEAEIGKSLNAVSPAQAQQSLETLIKNEVGETNLAKVTRKALKTKVFEGRDVHRVKADENSIIYFEGSYLDCQDWIDTMSDLPRYKKFSFFISDALPKD